MFDELATTIVIDALHAAQIPVVIVGSLSSNEWGIPRSTKDAWSLWVNNG